MGTLRIEQYSGLALAHRGLMQMPQLNLVTAAETLTTSGTSAASATVLQKGTRALFLRSTGGTNIAVRIGENTPVALTTDAGIASGEGRWFGIDPAMAGRDLKLAAIDY